MIRDSNLQSNLHKISLAVGFTVFNCIEHFLNQEIGKDSKYQLKIKLYNDIYLNNRKLCGILSEVIREGELQYLIIGVGLNFSMNEKYFSLVKDERNKITSITHEFPSISREKKDNLFTLLEQNIINDIDNIISLNSKENYFNFILSKINQNLMYLNSSIKVIDDKNNKLGEGIFKGLDQYSLGIIIENNQNIQIITKGELHI